MSMTIIHLAKGNVIAIFIIYIFANFISNVNFIVLAFVCNMNSMIIILVAFQEIIK